VLFDIVDGDLEGTGVLHDWLREGDGFLLLYDVGDRASFRNISAHVAKLLRVRDCLAPPMVLVGAKCDDESRRVVTTSEGEALAKTLHVPFFEASAKAWVNVEEAFYDLVRAVRRQLGTECYGARELVQWASCAAMLVLLANRFARGSCLHTLPRDVAVVIARHVWSARWEVLLLWRADLLKEPLNNWTPKKAGIRGCALQ
jgi:hypothetical protein